MAGVGIQGPLAPPLSDHHHRPGQGLAVGVEDAATDGPAGREAEFERHRPRLEDQGLHVGGEPLGLDGHEDAPRGGGRQAESAVGVGPGLGLAERRGRIPLEDARAGDRLAGVVQHAAFQRRLSLGGGAGLILFDHGRRLLGQDDRGDGGGCPREDDQADGGGDAGHEQAPQGAFGHRSGGDGYGGIRRGRDREGVGGGCKGIGPGRRDRLDLGRPSGGAQGRGEAGSGQTIAQAVPPVLEAALERPHGHTQAGGGLIVREGFEVAEDHGLAKGPRQPGEGLVEIGSGRRIIPMRGSHGGLPAFVVNPAEGIGPGSLGDPQGHPVEPGADQFAAADGPGAAGQDEEGGLGGVLGVVDPAQDAAAHAQDHRPVAVHQGGEGPGRSVGIVPEEMVQEAAIGLVAGRPAAKEGVEGGDHAPGSDRRHGACASRGRCGFPKG